MGTITIKNLSTLTDKAAALIAAEYWNYKSEAENEAELLGVKIIKKGHTFTIVGIDIDKED